MSNNVYRSSEDYIARQIHKFEKPTERARLILDIADVFTGPTSGYQAVQMATRLVEANSADEIVARLKEIVQRYEEVK